MSVLAKCLHCRECFCPSFRVMPDKISLTLLFSLQLPHQYRVTWHFMWLNSSTPPPPPTMSSGMLCLILSLSHIDKPDSVGLVTFVQLFQRGNFFTPSTPTSSPVVTSSAGLGPLFFFFFLLFLMGTQNGHNVPFLESASHKKRKRNVMKRIKQFYKISKKGNKKKSGHLVPKVVIDLPFERRKVEGSRKYRRRESSTQ